MLLDSFADSTVKALKLPQGDYTVAQEETCKNCLNFTMHEESSYRHKADGAVPVCAMDHETTIRAKWFVRVGMLATMRVESYLNASIRFIDVSNPKDFIHQKDTFPYKVIGLLLRDDLFSVYSRTEEKRIIFCVTDVHSDLYESHQNFLMQVLTVM
ncbi:hypothetical protein FXO38_35404 [Capsicum annuum]|nr:hypothetical protein FXO38_35404 [Capsicum annuum]KAF3624953.1 hypothetical protein FXO37_31116 [Capsicum annuum]